MSGGARARRSSPSRVLLTRAKLYGRSGCHLCEQMAAELRALGVAFEEIDVDSDPQLRLKYGPDVPVLMFEDWVCKHRLTPEAIAKLR